MDERFIMIFKLVEDEDKRKYIFDKLALINENGTIKTGNFKGKDISIFPEIKSSGNFFLKKDNVAIVAVDTSEKSIINYAFYDFQFERMIEIFKSGGIKKSCDQLSAFHRLGEQIELVSYNDLPVLFKVIRKDNLSKIDYWENNKNNIKDYSLEANSRNILGIKESKDNNVNIDKIIDELKTKIVGQDYVIESVIANIYANQRIIATNNQDLISNQKASILLDGPTGTGKTAIIKEIADKLALPIVITSATAYSGVGYVGSSLTDILISLLDKTKGNLELAQRGIVCIDEIDKLGSDMRDTNLKMRYAIQEELLTYISGAKFEINYNGRVLVFDTSNLTFVGMGAFTKIRDQKIEEKKLKKSKSIGFAVGDEDVKEIDDNMYVITEQDYINYGLKRELVARFSLMVSTKSYSIDDYKDILLNSSISPLKMFITFAKSFGVLEVLYDDNFIQRLAEMAYRDNFGARGLQKIISNLKNSLLLDIINGKYKVIELSIEMLNKIDERNIRTY